MFEKFFGSNEKENEEENMHEDSVDAVDGQKEQGETDPLMDALKQDEGRRKKMINEVRDNN